MLSQKDAVYQATIAVLEQNGIQFEDGQNVREVMKDNIKLRGQIRELVFEGLKTGAVAFGGGDDQRDDRSLRTYSTGLISNWFRKDKRLNGGQRYQPSISRDDQGSSGERKIRALRAAIDSVQDDELKAKLQEEIDDITEQEKLQDKLASDVKAGRYTGDEEFDENESSGTSTSGRSRARVVDQDTPPSMGSGHRGAVTDPEHDMRLKRNETPELHESRVEAGQKGGLRRGGSQGGDEDEDQRQGGSNIFLSMLKKRA